METSKEWQKKSMRVCECVLLVERKTIHFLIFSLSITWQINLLVKIFGCAPVVCLHVYVNVKKKCIFIYMCICMYTYVCMYMCTALNFEMLQGSFVHCLLHVAGDLQKREQILSRASTVRGCITSHLLGGLAKARGLPRIP